MSGEGGSGSGSGTPTPVPPSTPVPTPSVPTGPNGNQLVTSITTTEHENIEAEDGKGNKVVVPNGFKFAEDSGQTVQDGIVVEDSSENQFVWIPVSNINHDGNNKIIKNDGTEVEITLGRYTFDTSTGAETKIQYGSEWESKVTFTEGGNSYSEDPTFREGTINTNTGVNATAHNLSGFIESVEHYGGFFMARYEASRGAGSSYGVGDDPNYIVPVFKVSNGFRPSYSPSEGELYCTVQQSVASKACRQLYYWNSFVESDLVNSYMWDTTILYIQSMGNWNYANRGKGSNTQCMNTGETGDEVCHIFDLAGNMSELTTEHSSKEKNPCVLRGGWYGNTAWTAYRASGTTVAIGCSFRAGVWVRKFE